VHNLGTPQPWLFPIFPWAAFAFAGLAVGALIFSPSWIERSGRTVALFGLGGVGIFLLSGALDRSPIRLYATYDYWHTSPNFFLARVGIVLVLLLGAYAWCNWGLGQRGFTPFVQLGQTSLLVYWVHTELVYGRLSLLKKGSQSAWMCTIGFLLICVLMLALSIARTRTKSELTQIWKRLWGSGLVAEQTRRVQDG